MLPSFMERIFGANWRTSLSGIGVAVMGLLTTLAALPYTMGDIAAIVPPDWKPLVFKVSAAATVILKVINAVVSKDKNVAGTGAVDEPFRKAEPDQPA